MLYGNRFRTFLLPAVFAALFLPVTVNAGDRVVIDESDANLAFAPMYARIMDNLDSDYVPIVFYRDPTCVDEIFDLLMTFDLPSSPTDPGSFGCLPLTIEGFAIFEDFESDPPGIPPRQAKYKGDAVPFVFVEREIYNDIAADGLQITELVADGMNVMWGTATSYKEVLQPKPGSAKVGLLNIVAKGTLDDDGTPFSFRVTTQVFGDFPDLVLKERVFRLKFD